MRRSPGFWLRGSLLGLGLGLFLIPETLGPLLKLVFADDAARPYPLSSPLTLLSEHLFLVLTSSVAAGFLGASAAAAIHLFARRWSRPLFTALGTVLQTFPPVAVLALLVPVVGFGNVPVFWALLAFGVLPVFHAFLASMDSLDPAVLEAAQGLGLKRGQIFRQVRLPLALPGLVNGLKASLLINLGTATLGASMGAGGLGRPIMAGLSQFNLAYLFQGAATTALLSLAALWLFDLFSPPAPS